ncbi:MAG: hypothetical protein WC519_01690 [Parcubacteria group bacterium]
MNKKLIIPIALILTILVSGGAGFFAGKTYGVNHLSRTALGKIGAARDMGQNGAPEGGFGNRQLGNQQEGMVAGEILSISDGNITVKTANGDSKIILIGEDTKVTKETEADKNELIVGKTVIISGTNGSDNTLTANIIQVK